MGRAAAVNPRIATADASSAAGIAKRVKMVLA
jgi:hypothetical protein